MTGDVTLSAEDVQGEPRFNQTIDLTGLSSDRYYPVWWKFPFNERGANSWLTIHRNYAENRENKNPFGKDVTHLAGLEVQIEGSDTLWGGDAQYLNIKRINQRYRNTVKKIQYGMMSIARSVDGKYPLYYDWKSGDITECRVYSGCYLRGGLTYHVTSNFNNLDYSRKEDEVEIWHGVSDSDKREIKWTVKSYAIDDPLLGKDYDDTVTPYGSDITDMLYPVGIVVWFAQNKNPNNLFPGTSWKYIGENRTVRLAAANGSNVLSTGGNDTKWLSVNQIPKHSHSFSANTSNAGGHNHSRGDMNITGYLPSVIQHGDDVFGGAFARNGQNKPAVDYTDHWKELTTFDASRTWTGHTSWGGEHIHNVSGTTSEIGKGEGFDVTNSYVMLMGWYRIS
ncbi:putative tail fiber protein from lambdoid prophage [Xenorhabdus bovienii SS-2004]|uniref:Putative tail fiber protein from lambdoid prophage n=1 Tax=Xenorhabdus bovienii (strain SS-2004) TaxID=406818 RepID=D3V0D0_XENBS|nr:putative tail fiber protein from lambdoid prophage [Xenorhabdus bovienii SS-2004]